MAHCTAPAVCSRALRSKTPRPSAGIFTSLFRVMNGLLPVMVMFSGASRSRTQPRHGSGSRSSDPVLLVADLLQPVDDLAVEPFLNGDVGHRGRWRGPVPVLFSGRTRDHVPRPDLLDRPPPRSPPPPQPPTPP